MKVLVSGCSFTHWPEEPGSDKNICWPTALQRLRPDFEIKNLAEPGAGNVYIANGVVRYLLENPDFDMVLIMWSGVSRIDFLTDLTNDAWHRMFDDFGFYRRVESCPGQLGYIFSGGALGPWNANPDMMRLFKGLYMVSNNTSLAHTNLIEIIKCQEFLKARRMPYRFMSYVNYWNHTDHCSPNGDFGVLKYPELRPLIDNIDWSQWIFQDSDKNGIYEMAKLKQDYHGDRFHPGVDTHDAWAHIVAQNISTIDLS
jgi:hypothetical protein